MPPMVIGAVRPARDCGNDWSESQGFFNYGVAENRCSPARISLVSRVWASGGRISRSTAQARRRRGGLCVRPTATSSTRRGSLCRLSAGRLRVGLAAASRDIATLIEVGSRRRSQRSRRRAGHRRHASVGRHSRPGRAVGLRSSRTRPAPRNWLTWTASAPIRAHLVAAGSLRKPEHGAKMTSSVMPGCSGSGDWLAAATG